MKVNRYYLEINSLKNLNKVNSPNNNLILKKVFPPNIELNKFFYKNIGKKHRWIDRLAWDNLKWISYLENENVSTFVLKINEDLIGYFEVILDKSIKSSEIAYFGILEEYQNKKLGSFLLSYAIKKSFRENIERVWLHTCSLDHKNALNNYLARGMKIFKSEIVRI